MATQLHWDSAWIGATVATMQPGPVPYGLIEDAAIGISGDHIAWVGPAARAAALCAEHGVQPQDGRGLLITPGLIDCHTHLVFAGDRAGEFEQRLLGVSYEQIARDGGGIRSTVAATRAASEQELEHQAEQRARALMREGVTTIEIKSGYGLDLVTERRMLAVARRLGHRLPLSVKTTYLGLHALPPQFSEDRAAFVAAASGPWLAALHDEGLVDAVDAFCEGIAFTREETRSLLGAAQRLGLPMHLHADQLSDFGAARLAAEFGALSADHLEYTSAEGIEALARAGCVAVLLPGAYYTLRETRSPPIEALRRHGVPMAVATDCNPGTSPCTSLLLMMNMACTLFALTPEESLAGVTREAARALGTLADRGTIEVGKRADLALWRVAHPAELSYRFGVNPCAGVIRGGVRHDQS
jgi:imidazolonepropionase